MLEDLAAATGPLLILTSIGAKTGEPRTIPLGYLQVDDRLLIVASMAGSTRNPPWYYNLVANPEVTVTLGAETFAARAKLIQDADREQIFPQVCALNPAFAAIQENVQREVPVFELLRS